MSSLRDDIRDKNLSNLASFRDRNADSKKSDPETKPKPPLNLNDPDIKGLPGIEDVRKPKRKRRTKEEIKAWRASLKPEPIQDGELQQEAVEANTHLEQIEKSTTDSNATLSKLSSQLESKFSGQVQSPQVVEHKTTEEIIKDFAEKSKSKTESTEPAILPAVLPEATKKPNLGGATTPKEQKAKSDSTKASHPAMKVFNVVKSGFKSVKSVGDKIAGFLFKGALTAAIEAAKMAGIIFLIIAAIDLVRIHFKYWTEKFSAKFDAVKEIIMGYFDRFGNWMESIMPMFSGLFDAIDYIRNVFAKGDWSALAGAIGNVMKEAFNSLGAMIQNGIAKLASILLRKFGFNDTADSIEAIGLENKQNMTNTPLTPEEQKKVAKQQQKMLDKDYTPTQTGITAFLPDKFRKAIGALSDGEYDQIQAEKKNMSQLKGLNKEDQTNTIGAMNEARAALNRYENKVERLDPNDPNQAAKIDNAYKEAKTAISDPDLKNVPDVKIELENQLGKLQAKTGRAAPKPAPAANSPEAAQANSIARKTNEVKAPVAQAANNTNVNTTMVKNNKSVHVQAPVTSTNAPGVFHGTGVN
ncbi:baseplate hub subunit and tail length [Acinetobacter phage 133]|uniref:Gp29 baseplate hub n=1 Tax=Acinetobacter phage 133 TaxID=2919552 RepID=D9I6C9_9CAUD|nr:baseplate hub subunit and tail length [Acinetobacter phage 133]ADJ19510.1 gp29 baseplate hub [Acinetobacter phage 133]